MNNKPNFNNTSSKKLHHTTLKYTITRDFNELDEKFKAGKIKNTEELKEYKRLKRTVDNFPKMDNVFKYQENLVKYQEAIIDELRHRKFLHIKTQKNEAYMDKLEDDLQKLKDKILDINSKLRDPNISDNEKERLSKSLEDYKNKLGENQLEFSRIYSEQDKFEKGKQKVNEKFKKLSEKDLCVELEKSSIQISKCSLYLEKLSKGESLDGIKIKEEKIDWVRFVAKGRESEKIRNLRTAQKTPLSLQTQIGDFVSSVMGEPEPQPQPQLEPNEETANLVKYNDFDTKHPRLAKIKNWFKNKINKIRNRNNQEPEYEPEEQVQEPATNQEPSQNKNTEFRDTLRQKTMADYDISKIAEIGQDNYEQEIGATSTFNKSEAAKRLLENRKKLYGDSERNMNTNISDKLEEKYKESSNNDEER